MSTIEIPLPTTKHGRSDTPPRRVGVSTLGCKVNAFESVLIAQALRTRSWELVGARDIADLYIINTCTVTQEADRQARQEVRRAVRRNPDAMIVVTGCYAQIDPDACAAIPGVDLVLGNGRKLDVHDLLPQLEAGNLPKVMVDGLDRHLSLPQQLITGIEGRTRAFVQVQQGCNQGCTFCIIHRARGPSRSLTPGLVRRQVQRLLLNGYREIVLCGVDLGSYGADLAAAPAVGLADLLHSLVLLPGDFRIRLSSIDPSHLDDRLIALMASEPRICPHLHLSLQSGNDLVLKRMKRRYTSDLVRDRVARLRERLPNLVLSADVMVGFPTETEAQFRDTEQMVRELEIAYPHVFVYSARRGTPAARIPAAKHVSKADRRARSRRLRQVGEEVRSAVLRRRVGRRERVLVEGGGNGAGGLQRARAADYLPVWVPEAAGEIGCWVDVEYAGVRDDALIARIPA